MMRLLFSLSILFPIAFPLTADTLFTELPPFTVIGEADGRTGIPGTYVSGETVRQFGFMDVAEIAHTVPGLTASPGPRGGPRNERRLFLRGFDSRQILLLVDGIPFYIPYDGEPGDFERFRLWNAETIEISKGISSVLFGPNAMGGAINIATAPPARAVEGEAFAETGFDRGGEFQQWNGFLRGGFRKDAIYGQVGVASLERDFWRLPEAFEAAGDPVYSPQTPGNLEDGGRREQSAVSDRSAFARFGWIPRDGTELSVSLFHQEAEKEVPPYAGPPNPLERVNFFNWPRWDRTGVFLHGRLQPAPDHRVRLRLYYDAFTNRLERYDDWTYSTQETPRSFTSEYDDQSLGGSGEWAWSGRTDETWIGVLHFRRDDHEESANLLPGRRTPVITFLDHTVSIGLEQRKDWGESIRTVAGLSFDHRSPKRAEDSQRQGAPFEKESVEAWNGVLSVEKEVTGNVSVNAGIARKSRLPAMIDRYSYRQGRSIPNPGLEAETAWNTEVGANWTGGNVNLQATAFLNRVRDLMQDVIIGEDPDVPGTLVSQIRNVGEAEFLGVEVAGTWRGDRVEARLSYAFTERSLDSETAYNLVGVPRHEANLFLTFRPVENLELIPIIHAASERLSSEFLDGDPVDGFVTASLRVNWNWSESLRMEAAVQNLFDELYRYDRGYPEPGRTFTIGLRWKR